MMKFVGLVNESGVTGVRDSRTLHRWSCEAPDLFWRLLWDYAGVVGEPGSPGVSGGRRLEDSRFFPNGSIDVVATLLDGPPDDIVVRAWDENGLVEYVDRGTLRARVASVASRLDDVGVKEGDVVAAWATNGPAVLITMLATLSIGGVFTSSSVDFGAAAVVSRFGQVAPTVLLVTPTYQYAGQPYSLAGRVTEVTGSLPSLRLVLIDGELVSDPSSGNFLCESLPTVFRRPASFRTRTVPFNAPGWILYSSGTTGAPKCIVHRAGGVLLKHLSEHLMHCDIRSEDRVFYFTTPGWMMWNWLSSALACGAALVLYDGAPTWPDPRTLVRLARSEAVTYFGTSPGFLEAARLAGIRPASDGSLETLRTIGVTGAPLMPETSRYAAGWAPDVHVLSKSGGTDLCGGLVSGDPTSPVWPGEIQMPALGVDIAIVDDDGVDVAPGVTGELVSRSPFPSMPLGFVGDDGSRLHAAYYQRFPGCWHQSDFASATTSGGYVIHGRSDTTLNANGVRIGTAEIYAELGYFDEIQAAVAVGRDVAPGRTSIVLVLQMLDGAGLTPDLEWSIRARLRERCSPRHVPSCIVSVPILPTTANGKLSEVAVADVLNGRDVRGYDTLANQSSIGLLREVFDSTF